MGRIQKKKDPQKKKKAPRVDKSNREATPASNGTIVSASKPVAAKKTAVVAKPKAVGSERNLFQKIIQFLMEVKIELKKVAWPSRKQTMGSTVVVIVLVFIISLFLGVVDFGLSSFIRVVLP
jgi:preprotein translocase subunit SecE